MQLKEKKRMGKLSNKKAQRLKELKSLRNQRREAQADNGWLVLDTEKEDDAIRRGYHLTHNTFIANYRAGSPAAAIDDIHDFYHSGRILIKPDPSSPAKVTRPSGLDRNCDLKRVVAKMGFSADPVFRELSGGCCRGC